VVCQVGSASCGRWYVGLAWWFASRFENKDGDRVESGWRGWREIR